MASYRPLIVNTVANQIQELASGDSLIGISSITVSGSVSVTSLGATSVSVGSTLTVSGSIKDRYGSVGQAGAVLKSDGKNVFWFLDTGDITAGQFGYYSGSVVRGFTLGGYQGGAAYKRVSKTEHSIEVTTSLGDILSWGDAYLNLGNSETNLYTFYSTDNPTTNESGNHQKVNKFNMVTQSNVTGMADVTSVGNYASRVMRNRFIGCYVFSGTNNPLRFIYSTDTPTFLSGTFTGVACDSTMQTGWGPNKGWIIDLNNVKSYLNYSNENWSANAWSTSLTANTGNSNALCTYGDYMYLSDSNYYLNRTNNDTGVSGDIITMSLQERPFHTGDSRGYCISSYNAGYTANSYKINYASSTYIYDPGLNPPIALTSAGGGEYGKTTLV